ncbi:MAG: TIGR03936 family radical SAM-associated protein [Dehalococcoidales bacterium]|nr:TIGR03936 family radical SAM-associated protein [Dehalococcoidales bacterium]
MQRLRVRFSRGEEIKYISHLDIIRLWQRALNRAGIALAYSAGFNPHPRISLALALAMGVTSEVELMDIVLDKFITPHAFTATVGQQLPKGITISGVYNTPLTLPSLQSQVRQAEYIVTIATDKNKGDIEAGLNDLLDKETLPWQHQRDTGPRKYDLRALVEDLWLIDWRQGYCTVGMRLRCDSSGAGRPEQVAAALGFEKYPDAIHRSKLILDTN